MKANIKKGVECMKCLKIDSGKGYFSTNGSEYFEIDTIEKEHVLDLLNLALSDDDFELDDYNEELLSNKAHRVIYKNLHDKFVSLTANKPQFTSEVNDLYQDTLDKYKKADEKDQFSQESSEDIRG